MSLLPLPVQPLLMLSPCVTAPSVLKRASAVVSSRIEVVQSRSTCDPPNGGARGESKGDAKGRRSKRTSGRAATSRLEARNRQNRDRGARPQRRASAYPRLAAALRRDEVVKGFDL